MTHDRSILEAALIGYGRQLALIDQAIVELRRRIGSTASTPPPPAKRTRRPLSAAARASIAAAQRKRWAEYHHAKDARPKKRKLSAAGRKHIVEATKKRWAAFRARKAAAQEAAARMTKKTRKRPGTTDAAPAAS
jgi:hypothetical protein